MGPRALALAAALALTGCAAEGPPPVTAEKVLDVPDIKPVVNAVGLAPDGSLVVVGDMDGDLIARDVPSGAQRWQVRVHPRGAARRIDGVVVSPDGALVVTLGHDAQTIEAWQAATGRQVAAPRVPRSRGAAFHPTEQTLVVAAGSGLMVVDPVRAEINRTLPNAHAGERVDVVAFSGDGRVLASAAVDGNLKLWNWPDLTLRASMVMSQSLETMSPVSLALTRDGGRAAANGILGRLHVMDTAGGREERSFANVAEAPGHGLHAEMRFSLAFTADGDWLFAPDMHDRGLRILHVPNGKAYGVLRGDGPFYKAMAISIPASTVAFLRPGDIQGAGPYGIEVWRLVYRAK
jgi:WD40 repeat protein